MVDIHSHILPGVDDGAKTLEEAVAMAKMAAEAGTTDIVASPHANSTFAFDPELIEITASKLREACGSVIRIHTGCDFHLNSSNIQDALDHPTKYAINRKCYVLVEFSDFLIPPTTDQIFDSMLGAGMVPIITHPERNTLLHKRMDQIAAWVEDECLVQVTGQSFLGRFGRGPKAVADDLMRRGLVHFVASDAHDTKHRPPLLKEAYRYVAKAYGEDQAERLFVTNPKAALLGASLGQAAAPPSKNKKKWYQFYF